MCSIFNFIILRQSPQGPSPILTDIKLTLFYLNNKVHRNLYTYSYIRPYQVWIEKNRTFCRKNILLENLCWFISGEISKFPTVG